MITASIIDVIMTAENRLEEQLMECRTVKERFSECDFDAFFEEFFCYFRTGWDHKPTEIGRNSFRTILEGIEKVQPVKSDAVIEAEIMDELPGINYPDEESFSVNSKGLDLRMIDVFLKIPGHEEKFSFKLTEWENVLGYSVSEHLIQKVGLETLMAAILYEMTWFGGSAEEVHKYIEETEEVLEKLSEDEK